jgi:hypothetical protein
MPHLKAIRMTAAAARKKRIEEPTPEVPAEKRVNGMWIDTALLPTTLAQVGKKRELEPLTKWSETREENPHNRILEYADLVLGTKNERRAVDKQKK